MSVNRGTESVGRPSTPAPNDGLLLNFNPNKEDLAAESKPFPESPSDVFSKRPYTTISATGGNIHFLQVTSFSELRGVVADLNQRFIGSLTSTLLDLQKKEKKAFTDLDSVTVKATSIDEAIEKYRFPLFMGLYAVNTRLEVDKFVAAKMQSVKDGGMNKRIYRVYPKNCNLFVKKWSAQVIYIQSLLSELVVKNQTDSVLMVILPDWGSDALGITIDAFENHAVRTYGPSTLTGSLFVAVVVGKSLSEAEHDVFLQNMYRCLKDNNKCGDKNNVDGLIYCKEIILPQFKKDNTFDPKSAFLLSQVFATALKL